MSRARDVASNNLAVDTTPTLQGDLTMGSNSIADGVLAVKNNGTQSELRLYCEAGSHYVSLKSPAHSAFSGNHSITMPPNTGTSGQFLSTDGSGVTSWADAGGGAWELLATAAETGSNTQVNFNDVFSSTYDVYKLTGVSVSGGNYFVFAFKSGSGSTTVHTNDYEFVDIATNSNSPSTFRGNGNASWTYGALNWHNALSNTNYYYSNFDCIFFDPHKNVRDAHCCYLSNGTLLDASYTAFNDIRGNWAGSPQTVLTGLRLQFSGSQNITGSFALYGAKKS